jgi:hypothetical protein
MSTDYVDVHNAVFFRLLFLPLSQVQLLSLIPLCSKVLICTGLLGWPLRITLTNIILRAQLT